MRLLAKSDGQYSTLSRHNTSMDAHVSSFDLSIHLHLSRVLWDYQALTYARV